MFAKNLKAQAKTQYENSLELYQKIYDAILQDISYINEKKLQSDVFAKQIIEHLKFYDVLPPQTSIKVDIIKNEFEKLDEELAVFEKVSFGNISEIKQDSIPKKIVFFGTLFAIIFSIAFVFVSKSLAMSVAINFGKTSAGVAIKTLSQPYKTSSALAWLGGGSINSGGGGIKAGNSLLAMFNLLGFLIFFTIMALIAVKVIFCYRDQNKKIAQNFIRANIKIVAECEKIKLIGEKIKGQRMLMDKTYNVLEKTFAEILSLANYNKYNYSVADHIYDNLSDKQRNLIDELIENIYIFVNTANEKI